MRVPAEVVDIPVRDGEMPEELRKAEEPMDRSVEYFHYNALSLEIPASAREKTTAEGQFRYFPGASLVQWFPSGSSINGEVASVAASFEADIERYGLKQYLGFLPASTYHCTLDDVYLGDDEEVIRAVKSEVEYEKTKLAARGQSGASLYWRGLAVMAGTSVVLRGHAVSVEDLRAMYELREAFHQRLKAFGHAKGWNLCYNDHFVIHLTIAYFVKDVPAEGVAHPVTGDTVDQRSGKQVTQYSLLQEILRKYEDAWVGDSHFDSVELRRFHAMDDWSAPLTEITLPSLNEVVT